MKKILFAISHVLISVLLPGQSVSLMQAHYSGESVWNARDGVLSFETSGKIVFEKEDSCSNYFWTVPGEVKEIVIEENVTVTAGFHTFDDCLIRGVDRSTSVIFGTKEKHWANKREIKAWQYSHILNHKGILRMENLTMRNPYSFFVRSFKQVAHLKDCSFLDYRGGGGNHSDGFAGGDGSTVDGCYFATADDAIKVYDDVKVTNTTIEMVQNCVPIQLGWGNYSDGAVGTFKNLTIVGSKGRSNSDNAVISGRRGTYTVTIHIDGLHVRNPNAVLVSLWGEEMVLEGEIKNADIEVRAYSDRRTAGKDNMVICEGLEHKENYKCKEQ